MLLCQARWMSVFFLSNSKSLWDVFVEVDSECFVLLKDFKLGVSLWVVDNYKLVLIKAFESSSLIL